MKAITMTLLALSLFALSLFFNILFNEKNIDFANIDEIELINEINANTGNNPGASIKNISALFLGAPYQAGRLIGSSTEKEKLVVDFGKLDCFTYLDYVESLRRSNSLDIFFENLINIRYSEGKIDYLSRKHFFSDWVSEASSNINDVTKQISPHASTTTKYLNEKSDGGTYVPNIAVQKRVITFIPSVHVDTLMLSQLKDGDYIGIYSDVAGLDVSHTGIFIRGKKGPVLRHASSSRTNMKVVDSPFVEFVKNKPGILVYRAS